MAAEGFTLTMLAVLPSPSKALEGAGARQVFGPATPHSFADTPIPGPRVADKGLLGLVQIGRFLGNTQPQVRTLSGPFI